MPEQLNWRFCHKCGTMFFNEPPNQGVCAGGGSHEAAGLVFSLPHDIAETSNRQKDWRFCVKCKSMFFDPPANKGVCPTGGGHASAGFMFVLPHDIAETANSQGAWRFCIKCQSMFFDGFNDKGACAAGGPHAAAGFTFVLPHIGFESKNFDSGSLSSGLPLGGSVQAVFRSNGDFSIKSHAHDSGFDNIEYVISAVLMTSSGVVFTYQHRGHVEGTTGFPAPERNDDFEAHGNDANVANEWGNILEGSRFIGSISGKDKLLEGFKGMLDDLVKQVAAELGQAAAKAIVALVV